MSIKLGRAGTLFGLLVMLLLTGCSSKSFRVTSNPKAATVAIYNPRTNTYHHVGHTPLTLDEKNPNIPEELKGLDVWSVTIFKEGHVVEHLLFDRTVNPEFNLNANLRLNSDWADKDNRFYSDMVNSVGIQIQKINRNIKAGKYNSAMKTTLRMIEEYPYASIFYDIKGSIYILTGKNREAIAAYQKSLQLKPDSMETLEALKRLGGTPSTKNFTRPTKRKRRSKRK